MIFIYSLLMYSLSICLGFFIHLTKQNNVSYGQTITFELRSILYLNYEIECLEYWRIR